MWRKVKEKGERMSERETEKDREREIQKICFHLNFLIVIDTF